MKLFFRTAAILTGLALIAVAVAALWLAEPLSTWINRPAADTLSRALGFDVRMEQCLLVPGKLGFELRGLTVSNPPGYETGPLLRCGRVLVQPRLSMFLSGGLSIHRLKLEELEIHWQSKPGQPANLIALRDLLAEKAKAAAHETASRAVISRVAVASIVVRDAAQPAPLLVPGFEILDLSAGKLAPAAQPIAVLLNTINAQIEKARPAATLTPLTPAQ